MGPTNPLHWKKRSNTLGPGQLWTPSNLATLGTCQSVLIRGVGSFLGWICTIQWTPSNPAPLGTSQSVLIRGVASFRGSRLEGVHCTNTESGSLTGGVQTYNHVVEIYSHAVVKAHDNTSSGSLSNHVSE